MKLDLDEQRFSIMDKDEICVHGQEPRRVLRVERIDTLKTIRDTYKFEGILKVHYEHGHVVCVLGQNRRPIEIHNQRREW